MTPKVTTRVFGNIGEIIISNPERKNAMTYEMWRHLRMSVEELNANDYAKVVVVRGAGSTFVAGADISEFRTIRQTGTSGVEYDEATEAAVLALARTPKPTIAAIAGYCFGGGLAIATACDFQIADVDAKFQIPAALLGVSYPPRALERLIHMIGPSNAKRLIFTAARIDAQSALSLGLISEVAYNSVDLRVEEFARSLAENAPLSLRATKRLIEIILCKDDDLDEVGAQMSEMTLGSLDYSEALTAFEEGRKPNFQGR